MISARNAATAGAHRRARQLALAGLSLPLCACEGALSTVDPLGPVARALAETWWVMLVGGAAIFAGVMLLVLYPVFARSPRRSQLNGNVFIASGGLAFPVVVLTALLIYSIQTSGRVQLAAPNALRIEVIGHQWWWEVRYPDYPAMITANEIHVPAGEPVLIELISADVIHSFWLPRLAGKIDVLPEQRNRLWLQADAPGEFRGQCAEFCGAQHARMSKLVIAEPRADFEAWIAAQSRPALPPASGAPARGADAFARIGCHECHSIRGLETPKRMEHGPDLTHVGARRTIAAASLANTRQNLRAWVANSQAIKPGNKMPRFDHVDAETLDDLAAFLEGLR